MKKPTNNKKKNTIVLSALSLVLFIGMVTLTGGKEVSADKNLSSADPSVTASPVIEDMSALNDSDESAEQDTISNNGVSYDTPKDVNQKPDNGLMTRVEMFEYEPHMEKVEDTTVADKLAEENPEMTEEELILEEIKETGRLAGEAVTFDELLAADEAVQKQRIEKAKAEIANGTADSLPDVGTSNIPVIEGTKTNTHVSNNSVTNVVNNGVSDTAIIANNNNVSTNGIVSVDRNTTSDNSTVTIGVAENQTSKTTKTIVRVYDPQGNKTEYVVEDGNWSDVPLNGKNGDYTINVYQDSDGKGYHQVSQSIVTKGDDADKNTSSNDSYESTIDSKPEETRNSNQSNHTVVANNATTESNDATEKSEKAADTASAPKETTVVSNDSTAPVETANASSESSATEESAPVSEEPAVESKHESVSFDDLFG